MDNEQELEWVQHTEEAPSDGAVVWIGYANGGDRERFVELGTKWRWRGTVYRGVDFPEAALSPDPDLYWAYPVGV